VMTSQQAESALEHLWAIREIDRVTDLTPMLVGTAP